MRQTCMRLSYLAACLLGVQGAWLPLALYPRRADGLRPEHRGEVRTPRASRARGAWPAGEFFTAAVSGQGLRGRGAGVHGWRIKMSPRIVPYLLALDAREFLSPSWCLRRTVPSTTANIFYLASSPECSGRCGRGKLYILTSQRVE